ncbi:hypothetical protein Patl1_10971 [Pistacia atlantica]|uniref:Uncharacterized protein n=1 Tax=Pistacia atlantica TaxID=434234 RepID=A0ACC1A3D2_9ROSI|nr:hypothetical protein Patl1_10971 [Pistacia atlantica]
MGRTRLIITPVLLFLLFPLQDPLVQGLEEPTARNLKQEAGLAHEVHCSRERSRAAWDIIEEYLMPFVEQERFQISNKCRLHQDNDMFRDQEQHKIHVDINEWRCGYCKKSFRAEKFLDQHFDNRHHNLLNVSHSNCLADLCGALHCDFVMNSKSSKAKCNPAAVARNRHLCESLANNCFRINQGPSASRLHEANEYILPGYFHFDFDAATHILSYCLFVSKRNEKGNPRAQANLSSWPENKTLIIGTFFFTL